jgi:16S rRNA (cytosine967-C5)-methyltransferase
VRGDITKLQDLSTGRLVVIQDEASQLVAAIVGRFAGKSKKDLKVLDCCAAPGGKTLAIADANPSASILAAEIHPHRARLLQRLVTVANPSGRIRTIVADACQLPTACLFDRVLADVPCSGTGTLARNPEIKWRLGLNDLADLHARQSAILHSAIAQVAPGGRVVYSTCSLEKEENEIVIEGALADNNSISLVDCRIELERLKAEGELVWPDVATLSRGPYLRTIPGIHPCDGFFAAILEKI